ncbi:MAG: hypothetical protein AB7O38_19265 [Pirellulaceae bacterium]
MARNSRSQSSPRDKVFRPTVESIRLKLTKKPYGKVGMELKFESEFTPDPATIVTPEYLIKFFKWVELWTDAVACPQLAKQFVAELNDDAVSRPDCSRSALCESYTNMVGPVRGDKKCTVYRGA